MAKILVTGGCGYIGSHTLVNLIQSGFEVISADNLINGSEDVLDGIQAITGTTVENYRIDLCDLNATERIFKEHSDLTGIIHFAALKAVGESVEKPLLYFNNNMNSLGSILGLAKKYQVPHIIFSSSCTVYGQSDELPVTEHTPIKKAESPYGMTKQMGEAMVEAFVRAYKMHSAVLLRYFNPAGAHPSLKLGESPAYQAVNLVPVITETAAGKRDEMLVFGDDYDTRDGTCIRDYIHVCDLARAHTLALQLLIQERQSANPEIVNLGIGQGVSVLEAIQAFEAVNDLKLQYRITSRRSGDVPAIYSDYSKARALLQWEPKYGIDDIMKTAWGWEQIRNTNATK